MTRNGERSDPAAPQRRRLLGRAVDYLDQLDSAGLGRALLAEAGGLLRHPFGSSAALGRYALGEIGAAGASMARMIGARVGGPVAPPAKDKRFNDKAWAESPLYFALLQGHLLRERLAAELVEASRLRAEQSAKARLASQVIVDALAPTNFLLGNPVALKRAFETGGMSLLRGMANFLEDLRTRKGMPRQVDTSAFEVGKNLAVTPGKVVFQNDLMELLQYTPQTKETFQLPLLLSPPWINKYYIMDLAPGRSFAEWAVKHGHTTFAISYRNPDASMRDVSLDDYLLRGPLQALRVIQEITSAPKVNVAALCLGGTLATMLAAYLEEKAEPLVNSLTLLNTLVDFSEPGVLGAFTDQKTAERIARRTASRGYLDAADMKATFDLLRANDLVFGYVSSSWLMGEPPPAFDILAWNSDGTRLPARMHSHYLKTCYRENQLARDQMMVAGVQLRPSRLRQDTYLVGAVEDHITPWKSSFKTTGLLAGKVRFVLSNAGHIAGIVNPPGGKSSVHWTNDRIQPDPEAWQAAATRHEGTWWEDWAKWIGARAGERRAPPHMGSKAHPPQGDAPGQYVLEK